MNKLRIRGIKGNSNGMRGIIAVMKGIITL
jgi:hypothetical protein